MLYVFFVTSLADLVGNLFYEPLHFICKPLLMLSLLSYFWQTIGGKLTYFSRCITIALFFSWAGDIFLLFKGEGFFMAGLGSFLVAHVLYLCAYSDTTAVGRKRLLSQKPYLLLPFLVYLGVFYAFLYPNLAGLAVPVAVYATVLTAMGVLALNRYQHTSQASFQWIMLGAMLFIVSDSLLSLNLFIWKGSLYLGGFWVMLTYISAQYAIVYGAIAHK